MHIDPARRVYDDETRARLVDLFGAPERWGATTHSLHWARVDTLVPGFTGASSFDLEVPCTYDLEVAASKYFYSLPDGEAPLSFHFNGMILYRGERDRLQVAQVPWSCTASWSMPVAAWKRAVADQYPGGGWVRLSTETLDALDGAARPRAASTATTRSSPTSWARSHDPARGARQHAAVGGLRAVPLHAGRDEERDADAVRDRLPARLRGGQPDDVRPRPDGRDGRGRATTRRCAATARFLEPVGVRHEAVERRVELPATRPADAAGDRALRLRRACAAACAWPRRRFDGGLWRVTMCVHNTTDAPAGLDRTAALRVEPAVDAPAAAARRRALPVADRAARARRRRGHDVPLGEHVPGARDRRTDDALLGCAIMLPDHPQIAPESRGSLFDGTEIEEALRLHLLALSDGERAGARAARPGAAGDAREGDRARRRRT